MSHGECFCSPVAPTPFLRPSGCFSYVISRFRKKRKRQKLLKLSRIFNRSLHFSLLCSIASTQRFAPRHSLNEFLRTRILDPVAQGCREQGSPHPLLRWSLPSCLLPEHVEGCLLPIRSPTRSFSSKPDASTTHPDTLGPGLSGLSFASPDRVAPHRAAWGRSSESKRLKAGEDLERGAQVQGLSRKFLCSVPLVSYVLPDT